MVLYTIPNRTDPKAAGFSITTEHVAIVAGLAAVIWGRGVLRCAGGAGIAYGVLSPSCWPSSSATSSTRR